MSKRCRTGASLECMCSQVRSAPLASPPGARGSERASHFCSLRGLFLSICCAVCSVEAAPEVFALGSLRTDLDGTIHVSAYNLPLSVYMSEEARRAYRGEPSSPKEPDIKPPKEVYPDVSGIAHVRDLIAQTLAPQMLKAKARYEIDIQKLWIAGVGVYVMQPHAGIPRANRPRVLINLHAGGFAFGAGPLQMIEAMPVAATARIKVISIDYHLAPEHHYGARSRRLPGLGSALQNQERWLLLQFRRRCHCHGDIGATSEGELAGPGCDRTSFGWGHEGKWRFEICRVSPIRVTGARSTKSSPERRYSQVLRSSGCSGPAGGTRSAPGSLGSVPATLLITGTRDHLASKMINIHRLLVNVGVDADLHVWDGVGHSFYQNVDFPESQEVFRIMTRFFEQHLGR